MSKNKKSKTINQIDINYTNIDKPNNEHKSNPFIIHYIDNVL